MPQRGFWEGGVPVWVVRDTDARMMATDRLIFDGAVKGLAVGGGSDFFIDDRI